MRRAALLVLAVLLAACAAETVSRRKPRMGPVKEVGYVDYGGGEVRYSAEGWPVAVASRRRLALKLMKRNCGSDLEPRVTDEYTRQDADAPYAGQDIESSMSSGGEHFVIERYVHIAYECRPRGWVEPAPSTAPARAPMLVVPPVASTSAVSMPALSTSTVPSPSTSTAPSPEPKP